MIERISALDSTAQDNVKIVRALFDEIDGDGNGWIDRLEFRFLLRTLKLTYSDDRFNRLYRAVDTSGDGKIVWDELYELLFGGLIKDSDNDSETNQQQNPNVLTANDLHPSLFSSNSAKKRMVDLANQIRQEEDDSDDDNDDEVAGTIVRQQSVIKGEVRTNDIQDESSELSDLSELSNEDVKE